MDNVVRAMVRWENELPVDEILAYVFTDLPRGQIDVWRHRGKLTPAGRDRRGRLTYQLGHVRDLYDARRPRPVRAA